MTYSWDIIGHEQQLAQLEREIETGKTTHAYLFYGPKDTGKFTIAKHFANILLCPRYCHQCRDCQLISSGSHPDLIQMLDGGETIKIDDVRALIRKTNLTSQGKRRIVLIENIERMPTEAQNSFLKTLEEPAGDTVFIMTSTQVKKITPTIRSRCRQYSFSLLPETVLGQAMRERFKGHSDLEEVLQMAQGRPGLAIKLLSEPSLLASYRDFYHQIDHFLKQNDLNAKFACVEELDKAERDLDLFFDSFCFVLRKSAYDFLTKKSPSLAGRYELKEIGSLFEQLLKTRYLVDRNANKKLALENFFLLTEKH